MIIRLCITEGPRKGEEFVIKGEISVGRKGGDLQLRDSKSSSNHAKITINSDGLPQIEDLGSSNGTSVNGVKIKQPLLIKPGDLIQIGRTKIRVDAYVPENDPGKVEKGSWQEVVDEALDKAFKAAEDSPSRSTFGSFSPVLGFKFESGVQSGTEVIFAFGPRKFGAAGSDLLLYEPECPQIAFELFPTGIGECTLKSHSSMVRVNGKEPKTHKLVDGDKIEIGATLILVKALKEL